MTNSRRTSLGPEDEKHCCRPSSNNKVHNLKHKSVCIEMRWRSWLRHCATCRKVAGSVPDGVIEIFHLHNPFDRTMALDLTQPLTEMSTRNISWGVKCGRCAGLTTLPSSCAHCLEIWKPQSSWNPQGLSRHVMELLYIRGLDSNRAPLEYDARYFLSRTL